MKKIIIALFALTMVFSLTACGGSNNNDSKQESTVSESQTNKEAEVVSLTNGDTGAGPVSVDAAVLTMTVPKGLEYEVKGWYYDEEKSRASISLSFNKTGSSDSVLMELNTGSMVKNYDEAIKTSIKLKNLDTAKDGKYEMGAENTYGPLTYQAYHTSTEYGESDYLVSFIDFGEGMLVEIGDRLGSGLIPDPLFTEMLTSIKIK